MRFGVIIDNLSQQAKIALVSGISVFIMTLTQVDYKNINPGVFLALFILIGSVILTTYSIDCYSKGQCEVLAWVVSVIFTLSSVMTILGSRKSS